MASNGQLDRPALTLQLLQPADTTLVPVHPQFLQTLSDHLGDHLTPGDGFDALLNDPLSTIDAESGSVDSLGSIAPDVASPAGTFNPAALNAIAQDLATFNANGDTITQTFGVTSAAPSQPDPDTTGFKNTGDDGSGSGLPPPPPPGSQPPGTPPRDSGL